MKWLEIQFWKIAKRIIRTGYGADCKTRDTDDFPEFTDSGLNANGRCGSCRAREVIEWIDDHIALLESWR